MFFVRFTIHRALLSPTRMLTDYYQITMGYAYWKAGKMNDSAVFDLYFRKNPFKGEFTLYAGLEECIRFLSSFKFTKKDTAYVHG